MARSKELELPVLKYEPAPDGITIYTDGAIEGGNPGGWATWAFWACDAEGNILAEKWGTVGEGERMTHNVAEYVAVIRALSWAYTAGSRKVLLRSGSRVVVNQSTGAWCCSEKAWPGLGPHIRRVAKAGQVMDITFEWIPHLANKRADELSRMPYKEAREALRKEAEEYSMTGEPKAHSAGGQPIDRDALRAKYDANQTELQIRLEQMDANRGDAIARLGDAIEAGDHDAMMAGIGQLQLSMFERLQLIAAIVRIYMDQLKEEGLCTREERALITDAVMRSADELQTSLNNGVLSIGKASHILAQLAAVVIDVDSHFSRAEQLPAQKD